MWTLVGFAATEAATGDKCTGVPPRDRPELGPCADPAGAPPPPPPPPGVIWEWAWTFALALAFA